MQTSNLSGKALSWAVAEAEIIKGHLCCHEHNGADAYFKKDANGNWTLYCGKDWFNPWMDWAQGGAIIDREGISLIRCDNDYEVDAKGFCTNVPIPAWAASSGLYSHNDDIYTEEVYHGHTPLLAAMRCLVASVLGENVDVPKEYTPAP